MAFDPNSTAQLKQLNEKLTTRLNNLNTLKTANAQRNFLAELKALENTAGQLIQSLSSELDVPHDEVGFSDFLSDIGNSVVETQKKLDEQSRVYLEQTKGERHITPAIYRLPKVSASIKFGMRKTKKEGFNIIVAQRTQEDEKMLNQSLDFEIISVPPPPDYQQSFSDEIPSIGFLFSTATRTTLFNEIKKYQPRLPEQKDLNQNRLLKQQKRVLILQLNPPMNKDMEDFLLLLADEGGEQNVGIWLLSLDPSGKKKSLFEMILKFTANGRQGEKYDLLRKIMLAHSNQQAKLLQ